MKLLMPETFNLFGNPVRPLNDVPPIGFGQPPEA